MADKIIDKVKRYGQKPISMQRKPKKSTYGKPITKKMMPKKPKYGKAK